MEVVAGVTSTDFRNCMIRNAKPQESAIDTVPILYVVSALGKVPNQKLSKLVAESNPGLSREHILAAKKRLIGIFQALGHWEPDYRSRAVYCCRPSIVRIPSCDKIMGVLVGARFRDTAMLIARYLGKKAEVEQLPNQSIMFTKTNNKFEKSIICLPETVVIKLKDNRVSEALASIGIKWRIDEIASWKLVQFSVSLAEIEDRLEFSSFTPPNWEAKRFSIGSLRFINANTFEEGLYIFKSRSNKIKIFYKKGNEAAEIGIAYLTWGRYFAIRKRKEPILMYDRNLGVFAVPSAMPLPPLLEKAAVLCSGFAPHIAYVESSETGDQFGCSYSFYSNVPPPIAEKIAEKLSQGIKNIDLKKEFEVSLDGRSHRIVRRD